MKRPDLRPSYYGVLLQIAGGVFLIVFVLYLHLRPLWTLVWIVGVAVVTFVGVLVRLWVARIIERSAVRARADDSRTDAE